MQGFITHASNPNIITACTNSLKKVPDTLGLAPSLPSILVSRTQLFCSFRKFPTNARKLSSNAVKICPNYLKDVTVSRFLL